MQVNNITSNNITAVSDKGFVKNCTLTTSSSQINTNTQNILKEQNLEVVSAYDINFSYLKNDNVTITIPLDKTKLLMGLNVYMLYDGKLTKLDSSISNQGITFNTTKQNATYLIIQEDNSSNSNREFIVLVIIISIYIGLAAFAIISSFKQKTTTSSKD